MNENIELMMPIKAAPYDHQKKAFAFACDKFGVFDERLKSRGTALLMEMGTGKTIVSIAVAGCMYQYGKVNRVLVVAPLSILGVWEEEFKKLVIMDRFVPELDDIQELLEKKKIGYAVVRGGVKGRDNEIHRFQYDDRCRVFVGQIAAAGLGITLTAASTMVFYSLDYSMSNFEQAKARIHRAGQKENCHYIYLVCRGTVDRKVLYALRQKLNLAKMLVDDYRKGKNPFKN